MPTVICIKMGSKYPTEYVNILKNMVERNLTVPHEFVCVTDDHRGVECPVLFKEPGLPGWWQKLALFKEKPYGISGKILYLDLDIAITANINKLIEPDEFTIMNDPLLNMYNSSVMLIPENSQTQIWDEFNKDREKEMKTSECGDQFVITKYAKEPRTWPSKWCVSYRLHARFAVPSGCKIVQFHGKPDPHEVTGWVRDVWR